jgi:hypothetical protein
MADIIVRQANATSLTIQASSNQVLVRQQPNNTVVVQTTGNSYVLPVATNSTLGGIIVGDNLTINANGLLSAQAGGVSAFNNRTGNVTLTANDVSAVGNSLYFPLNANIVSGNATIAGQVYQLASGNGTLNKRTIYGISKTNNLSTTEYQFAIGMTYGFPAAGSVFLSRAFDTTVSRGLSQSEIDLSPVSAQLISTNKHANGTLVSQAIFGAAASGSTLYYEDQTTFSFMEVGVTGILFFGVTFGVNNSPPGPNELMTRSTCDNRYEPITRRN